MPVVRRVLTVAGALLALLASAAMPAHAQLPGDLGEIEGIDPLDPALNDVTALIGQLSDQLGGLVGDVPGLNTLALGGDDAVDAGVAFSRITFPDGADTAVLSRADLFADGLSSGAFQGAFDAPLLFSPSGDLDARTGHELARLGMSRVTILGGEDALHPLVVDKLRIAGLEVVRAGGPTRVETAIEAARMTAPDATTAVVARAYPDPGMGDDQAYADLLAAGPFAAEQGWPVLMTQSDRLTPSLADYLAESPITDVVVIGGEGAVSSAVQSQIEALGITARRVGGANRFATAVAIAAERGFADAGDADRVILAEAGARDDVWAPGFAASAHGDQHRAPVVLSDGPVLPAESMRFMLDGLADTLAGDGPAVVCATFVDPIACEAAGLLALGALTDVIDLLGLDGLTDIPGVGDALAVLGGAGLLPDPLTDVVDGAVGDVAGGITGDADLGGTIEGVLGGL